MSRLLFSPLVVVLITLALAAAGCSSSGGGGGVFTPTVEGSGVVVEEARPLGGCYGVALHTAGAVWIRYGPQETLLVRAEDNLLGYLTTEVQGGVLEIRADPSVDLEPTRPVEFHVTAPTLSQVTLGGVGTIDVADLTTNRLTLVATGAGTVRLTDLQADTIDVSTSGVVSVDVSGSVEHQDLQISGIGGYHAKDLASRTVDAHLSNIGVSTVRVSDRLTVTLTGSASLYYIGSPALQDTNTGSGELKQIGR